MNWLWGLLKAVVQTIVVTVASAFLRGLERRAEELGASVLAA